MTPVGLRFVARDTNAVGWASDDRVVHALLDAGIIRSGLDELLHGVHMERAGAMTRLAADHFEVLFRFRTGNVAARLVIAGDMAFEARRVVLVLLRKMFKRVSVIGFRPRAGLRAMADKALIRPDVRLPGSRSLSFIS